jgi:hypothetical protein
MHTIWSQGAGASFYLCTLSIGHKNIRELAVLKRLFCRCNGTQRALLLDLVPLKSVTIYVMHKISAVITLVQILSVTLKYSPHSSLIVNARLSRK